MKYDNGQEATLVRTCLRSERMGTPEFNRGPMLGEHTVSILKEAGYSDEEIEKYLSEGIIRQHDWSVYNKTPREISISLGVS